MKKWFRGFVIVDAIADKRDEKDIEEVLEIICISYATLMTKRVISIIRVSTLLLSATSRTNA